MSETNFNLCSHQKISSSLGGTSPPLHLTQVEYLTSYEQAFRKQINLVENRKTVGSINSMIFLNRKHNFQNLFHGEFYIVQLFLFSQHKKKQAAE